MSRRRRKFRPLSKEQESPAPFFVKLHPKEHQVTLVQPVKEQVIKSTGAEVIRELALKKLYAAKHAIAAASLDQPQVKQSKALELAQQMLAANISDIGVIHEALVQICLTLSESRFVCGVSVSRTFGSKQKEIQLGHSFKLLNPENQLHRLLLVAIRATNLPECDGLPASENEFTDLNQAWENYILHLLKLLPDQPYLITGTPYNRMPPTPDLEQENTIFSSFQNLLISLFRFISNLFRRR